jgi:hypothetical protein
MIIIIAFFSVKSIIKELRVLNQRHSEEVKLQEKIYEKLTR